MLVLEMIMAYTDLGAPTKAGLSPDIYIYIYIFNKLVDLYKLINC